MMNKTTIKSFLELLQKYTWHGFYVPPNIPQRKLSNVCDQYKIKQDMVLGLVDATLFGSATEGFVISTMGIHEQRAGQPMSFTEWEEICENPIIKGWFGAIKFGVNRELHLGGSGISSDNIVYLLENCKAFVKNNYFKPEASNKSSAPSNNIIVNNSASKASKICSKYTGSNFKCLAFSLPFDQTLIREKLQIPSEEKIHALITESGSESPAFQGLAFTDSGVYSFLQNAHLFLSWQDIARQGVMPIGLGSTLCGESIITLTQGPNHSEFMSLLEELAAFFTSLPTEKSLAKETEISANFVKQSTHSNEKIDIRIASPEALAELPGIGIVKAKKIISIRKKESFKSIEDFGQRLSIEKEILKKLVNVLTGFEESEPLPPFNNSIVSLVDINCANEDELLLLPGICKTRAAKVISARENRVGFSSLEELRSVLDLPPHIFLRLSQKITVGKFTPKGPKTSASGRIIDF